MSFQKLTLGLPWWLTGQCMRKIPHVVQQLSPCTTATKPVL